LVRISLFQKNNESNFEGVEIPNGTKIHICRSDNGTLLVFGFYSNYCPSLLLGLPLISLPWIVPSPLISFTANGTQNLIINGLFAIVSLSYAIKKIFFVGTRFLHVNSDEIDIEFFDNEHLTLKITDISDILVVELPKKRRGLLFINQNKANVAWWSLRHCLYSELNWLAKIVKREVVKSRSI